MRRASKLVNNVPFSPSVDWVIEDIPIKINIPAGEEDRVFGDPAADCRIVIPVAEFNQTGIPVMQATGEAEWHGNGWIATIAS